MASPSSFSHSASALERGRGSLWLHLVLARGQAGAVLQTPDLATTQLPPEETDPCMEQHHHLKEIKTANQTRPTNGDLCLSGNGVRANNYLRANFDV